MPELPRIIARHPVVAFMIIGFGAAFLTAAIPPIVHSEILPFDLPLHGVLGGALGVGVGAFVVTGAVAGRDGVIDLARRSTRWRVPRVGIWSRCSPFRCEQRSFHSPYMVQVRLPYLLVAGRAHWPKSPPYLRSNSCCFSWLLIPRSRSKWRHGFGAGQLDWWVKERRPRVEWWGRDVARTVYQQWIKAADLRPVKAE